MFRQFNQVVKENMLCKAIIDRTDGQADTQQTKGDYKTLPYV